MSLSPIVFGTRAKPCGDCLDGWCTMISKGLIAKIVVRGEDGYQACTYLGQDMLCRYREELSDGE